MPRFKYSVFAAVGVLLLVSVISLIGPKRALAALGYTPVRDVDGPARQPYVATYNLSVRSGFGRVATANLPAVPPGKRLVIESMSGFAEISPIGNRAHLSLNVNSSLFGFEGLEAPLSFTDTLTPNNLDEFSAQQPLSGYANAGDVPEVVIEIANSGDATAFGTVTGYLVDVP